MIFGPVAQDWLAGRGTDGPLSQR
ncbi:hypothetical protein [Pseudogemmobacter bohemicus]